MKLSNKPINSLKEIHVVWYRQINAGFSQRKSVLEKLMDKEADVAWQLFRALSPDPHAITKSIHTCRWRSNSQIERKVSEQDILDFYIFLFDKLLILAEGKEEKIAALINMFPEMPAKNKESYLQYLKEHIGLIDHSKDFIWNNLRTLIAKHREFPNAFWVLSEEYLEKLDTVLDLYAPTAESGRNLYLFKNMNLLDKIYLEGTIQKKRQIISSIFPEKLCFDEQESRIGRINEAVQLIHTLNKDFSETKSQETGKNLPAPDRVTLLGLMSNHFLKDLQLLASLSS